MLKSYDDRHEIRIEYLMYRACCHLKEMTETKSYFDKVYHWNMFLLFNDWYMEEKDERESKKD